MSGDSLNLRLPIVINNRIVFSIVLQIYHAVLHAIFNVETNSYYGKKKSRRRVKKVNDPDEDRNSLRIHMLILIQYFCLLRKAMYNSLPRSAYITRSR